MTVKPNIAYNAAQKSVNTDDRIVYEWAYEKFSEQDKKLISDLKKDNIDEIRRAIDGQLLPENVEKYMDYVVPKQQQGRFFKHYKQMMYDADGQKKAIVPYNLEQAEKLYIRSANLSDIIKIADFKPKGVEKNIALRFYAGFSSNFRSSVPLSDLAEIFKNLNPSCKKATVKLLLSTLDGNFKNINMQNDKHKAYQLLLFTAKLYDAVDEEDKNSLRNIMLTFRTTGDKKEKREKAVLCKLALKEDGKNIKQDETIKAISSVSYTPFSALNRQLKKYGKEM